MKNTLRILLLLAPVLLAAQICHADPLNGGIRTEDIVGLLLLIIVALSVFAAAPICGYLSYKRPGRQLNIIAWVLAIITKLTSIIFIIRASGSQYAQWGTLLGMLPNIGIYFLLLKAEGNLIGRQFQLAIFVRSILGIAVLNILFSMVLLRFLSLGNISIYQLLNGQVRIACTVWFVYQYLALAPSKGVNKDSGLLHSFVYGLAITLGLFINSLLMMEMVILSGGGKLSGITNIASSMLPEMVLVVANALLSGFIAHWLYHQKKKKNV